jgi:hypothetical protein
MKITMLINTGNGFEEFPVLNKFIMDERLDEELDGGNTTTKAKTPSKIPTFADTIVSLTDGETTQTSGFFCFPTAEKRAGEYYAQTLELVEPTRWLMGLTIDGLAVTQPIEGSAENRKTLFDTLSRVLSNYKTRAQGDTVNFIVSASTYALLSSVESPEFSWEGGTLLWEVLCAIADVVDCVPRLSIRVNGGSLDDLQVNYVISFEEVNKETGEFEL